MNGAVDLGMAVMNVELDDFGSSTLADVFDVHIHGHSSYLNAAIGRGVGHYLQIAVLELRVAEAEAEGELGLDVLGVVVAVADVNAFSVVGMEVLAGIGFCCR